jgi:hypothetical protein
MLKVSCFNGENWVSDWLETAQELPQLVEVSLVGRAPDGGVPSVESILVAVTTTAEVQAQADLLAAQQSSTSEATTSQTQTGTTTSTGGSSSGG